MNPRDKIRIFLIHDNNYYNFNEFIKFSSVYKKVFDHLDTKFGIINPNETKNKIDKKKFSKYNSESPIILFIKNDEVLDAHKNIQLFSDWILSCFNKYCNINVRDHLHVMESN